MTPYMFGHMLLHLTSHIFPSLVGRTLLYLAGHIFHYLVSHMIPYMLVHLPLHMALFRFVLFHISNPIFSRSNRKV